MARALMGFVGSGNDQLLHLEVARLRRRVKELELELTTLRTNQTHEVSLDHIGEIDQIHRTDPSLDLELHELAQSSAALA